MDILHENVCSSVKLHRSRLVEMALQELILLRHLATGMLASVAISVTGIAGAAVTEPDGLQVPNLAADHTSSNNETDLQQIFVNLGEPIDAIADASPDPGVFSPMCDFSIEFLAVCQSQGSAGVAWYNVPSDPTAIPDNIYQLLPPTKCSKRARCGWRDQQCGYSQQTELRRRFDRLRSHGQ